MRFKAAAAGLIVSIAIAGCASGGTDAAAPSATEPATTPTTAAELSDYERYVAVAMAMELKPMTLAESEVVAANVCDNTVSDFKFVGELRNLDTVANQAIVVGVWCPDRRLQYDQGLAAAGIPDVAIPSEGDINARLNR